MNYFFSNVKTVRKQLSVVGCWWLPGRTSAKLLPQETQSEHNLPYIAIFLWSCNTYFHAESEDVTDAADHPTLKAKRIYLADSGLVFNSPYPLVIRPQRGCDVLLSFDFSARDKEIEMPFEVI